MTLPVTLLTGFLGAGKTTLLNHLLADDHGLRIALVVNDFGSINIDARLVKSVDGDTIALSNGCICCDRRSNLRLTLQDLLGRPEPPEFVIVEASGIADPLALAAAFRTPELRERARLDGVITVVDAVHARDPRLDAQLVRDQIVAADIVLLNKIDLVDPTALSALGAWLAEINPRARLIETAQCRVPAPLLLGLQSERAARLRTPDDHDPRRHGFDTCSYSCAEPLDLHRLVETLKSLPPSVFRVKGILHLAEAPGLRIALHMVGGRIDTDILGRWEGMLPHTDLVLIGPAGSIPSDDLSAMFDRCVARADNAPTQSSGRI